MIAAVTESVVENAGRSGGCGDGVSRGGLGPRGIKASPHSS